jgi:8-oxo-dGTP pyrophosphatase MutT (NUDIX family)
LRERDHALETLMLLRHTALKFMAGAWVFPGGGLSPHDHAPLALSRLLNAPGETHGFKDKHLAPLARELVLGLYVCAFRETFEETGVLLAQHADGSPCSPELVARLQAERVASDRDASVFPRMLEREQLYLDAARLQYWAHWITPSALGPTRFDTRFFAVALPRGQDVGALSRESDRAAWLRWSDVQEMIDRGDTHVSPPTLSAFEDAHRCYERYGSVAAMLAQERGRAVLPILPKHLRTETGVAVLMPWDEAYAAAPGEGTPLEHAPAYLAAQPSRRVLNR